MQQGHTGCLLSPACYLPCWAAWSTPLVHPLPKSSVVPPMHLLS